MSGTGQPHTIRFGVFEVDLAARELRKRGVRVKLQDQPFRVLEALLEKPGEIITREELKERLWAQDEFVEFDKSLNTAVQKIRDALDDSAKSPRFLETVPKVGYRFVASVDAQQTVAQQDEPQENDDAADGGWTKALPWALAGALALVVAWQQLTPPDSPSPERGPRHFTITPELHGAPAYSRASWGGHRPHAAISQTDPKSPISRPKIRSESGFTTYRPESPGQSTAPRSSLLEPVTALRR